MHSFRQELWVTCNRDHRSIIERRLEIFVSKPGILVSVGMQMVLTMWLSNLGSVPLTDPLASKSNF